VEGANVAMRSQLMASSMKQIARYLDGLPGRKNLIWFSGASPQQFPPQPADPDLWPSYVIFDGVGELKSATDALARAHVAVYPVDSRIFEAINPRSRKGSMQLAEHESMDLIADQTGGKTFYNTNGLAEAALEAVNSGANFYTLTYTPANQSLDTRFRSITVKVDQPNVHLTYRNGYYAVEPTTTLSGKQIDRTSPMQSAMMRGSLEPTQILFKVRVAPSPTTDAVPSPANEPNPKLMHPPYRHYSISYVIDIHGIDGVYCAGINTRMDDCPLGTLDGDGHVDLLIPRLALLPGAYSISAGILDPQGLRPLDLQSRAYPFSVVSDRRDFGVVYLEHHWQHERGAGDGVATGARHGNVRRRPAVAATAAAGDDRA